MVMIVVVVMLADIRTRWERMDRAMGSASSPDASGYRASEGLTDHHICERSSTVGWPHH